MVESINAKKTIKQIRRGLSIHRTGRSPFWHAEAGIDGASSQSGRRQFVTELADKGINARVIQALARHKHLNTTMRYIDLNENKMRNAIELVRH